MSVRILLVEDEPGLRMILTDRLHAEGYQVDASADGDDGFEKAATGDYNLMLLDALLPGRGGFDICRDLRKRGVSTPILMVTARGETADKILGLKLGADDYLAKPFEMLELIARVEALLRRTGRAGERASPEARFGAVEVNFRSCEVTRDAKPVGLSAKEYQLLTYFLKHRGETISRDELLRNVWGQSAASTTRTVDVHVYGLRQKLEDDPKQPRWFATVHGLGYRLVE